MATQTQEQGKLLGTKPEVCGACHRPGQVCVTCGKLTNGESAFCRGCRVRQDEEGEEYYSEFIVDKSADQILFIKNHETCFRMAAAA